jgi:hypothetical protein
MCRSFSPRWISPAVDLVTDFRDRRFTGGTSGLTSSCRSVCVDSTTIVSVRVTPSMDRRWLINSSNVEVSDVRTFSSSV